MKKLLDTVSKRIAIGIAVVLSLVGTAFIATFLYALSLHYSVHYDTEAARSYAIIVAKDLMHDGTYPELDINESTCFSSMLTATNYELRESRKTHNGRELSIVLVWGNSLQVIKPYLLSIVIRSSASVLYVYNEPTTKAQHNMALNYEQDMLGLLTQPNLFTQCAQKIPTTSEDLPKNSV